MDSKKLALLCRELADNKKAEDIVVLDVRKISSVTDYFVIVSGTSDPHLRAIFNEIADTLKEQHDLVPSGKDGSVHAAWVVLDFFDVVVHIMRADVRQRYDLEGLWNDAPPPKRRKRPQPELGRSLNLLKQPAEVRSAARPLSAESPPTPSPFRPRPA
jgi:ribosome-associated protein